MLRTDCTSIEFTVYMLCPHPKMELFSTDVACNVKNLDGRIHRCSTVKITLFDNCPENEKK